MGVMVVVIVIMVMIVTVSIKRKSPLRASSKEGVVFRGVLYYIRRALTAYMAIQAQHAIRCGHDHVQIVANHQNGAIQPITHIRDLNVECCGPRLIQALRCFVKYQDVRFQQ